MPSNGYDLARLMLMLGSIDQVRHDSVEQYLTVSSVPFPDVDPPLLIPIPVANGDNVRLESLKPHNWGHSGGWLRLLWACAGSREPLTPISSCWKTRRSCSQHL